MSEQKSQIRDMTPYFTSVLFDANSFLNDSISVLDNIESKIRSIRPQSKSGDEANKKQCIPEDTFDYNLNCAKDRSEHIHMRLCSIMERLNELF